MGDVVSIPRAIADLALSRSTDPALIIDEQAVSWVQLLNMALHAAARVSEAGVDVGDIVAIASRNDVDFFVSTLASYVAGAVPMPLSSRLTLRERREILELAKPKVLLGFDDSEAMAHDIPILGARWTRDTSQFASPPSREFNLDIVSPSWKAPTSGGSTGRPKVIVATDGAAIDRSGTAGMLMKKSGRVCIPGPMYHNAPFSYAVRALAFGNTIVTTSHRFTARSTLQMVEQAEAYWLLLVPTMMHRILRDSARHEYSLECLESMWHVGSKCPDWVKDEWIKWLGPRRVWELYAGTEAQAITAISGEEWLAHRGSVGRAAVGEISIRGERHEVLPTGETGEIFLRPSPGRRSYHYIGAAPKSIEGGWESLGDVGHLDSDGYLYISDRLSDMIVTGGANVYPAEVESAIEESLHVIAAVVVGTPDDEFGALVLAVVQVAEGSTVTAQELADDLATRLAGYKIPKLWRLTTETLRDDAGKVRRSAWRGTFSEDRPQRIR